MYVLYTYISHPLFTPPTEPILYSPFNKKNEPLAIYSKRFYA